jgi:hypothetical protein
MKNPSVMIGIPSGDAWKADFGMSLAGLVAAAPKPLAGGGRLENLTLWNTKGSILSRSRHTLARKAQDSGATHLLMIDSDMTFPNWTLHQLLAADKDVVAANCATKGLPSYPTARMQGIKPAGELVSSVGREGLEKVWRVGTGVMLIKMKVFAKIEQPWFGISWNEENDDYTGEDWTFCEACRAAGIPVYIDHKLSQHIGHVGSFTYTMQHTEEI